MVAEYAPVIWFVAGLVILLLEFAAPGLILFFFGIGAWAVALLLMFLPLTLFWQLALFLLISVSALFLLRKRFQALFKGNKEKSADYPNAANQYVGTRATVVETITPPRRGKIELHGTVWNAEAAEPIDAGTVVEITSQNNLTCTVKKI